MLNEFKSLIKDTTNSAVGLYKIMIPVSIAVKLLQYLGWINVLGDALAPVMKWIGLPGACGIIWATTMVTNIYGGMMAFYSLAIQGFGGVLNLYRHVRSQYSLIKPQ